MSSHIITPGPYRATKLWNEVTRLFRAGMPLKKHRQNFRVYSCCFTASSAVDWLHEMLRCNSNFGPDVTRQQTIQLLKKFLKNHVVEDVKGRWGTEDLEDNNILYRFPFTSPLKPIPSLGPAPAISSMRRRPSLRDKEGFFKFKTIKKHDKESLENVDPALQADHGGQSQLADEQKLQRRELTVEDEQEIWRDITLTHLQRILGVVSLNEVLDPRCINPQNIIHNMTKVNKHGVVALDDKTNDLPHWVLSAMKSLANWPKYDSEQPSYPGFERDVFKTVSDYFYSLPNPLLTFELYELFINVLVFCGYITVPNKLQRGKRKNSDFPSVAPPAKSSFRSTECLLLSLLKQGSCDETESPMREVIGGKLQSRLETEKAGSQLGGSCMSLSTVVSARPKTRSFSLETILDDSGSLTEQLFQSNSSLASCSHSDMCQDDTPTFTTRENPLILMSDLRTKTFIFKHEGALAKNGLPGFSSASQRSRSLRPQSVGSCLDIAIQTGEERVKEIRSQCRSTSCLNVNTPASHSFSASRPPSASSHPLFPSSFLSSTTNVHPFGPRPASSTSNIRMLPAPAVVRRCQSSVDVSKPSRPISLLKPPVFAPHQNFQLLQTKSEHSVLQPHCERVAIEALQLCTLLLPPASRRKLQLLMRMVSRISQNVDMPRLHPAIGTRMLMVHTFSGCILSSAEECDLDELLATRLVSFLMDHQQCIFSVPEYLLNAISDHIQYVRAVQVPVDAVAKPESGKAVCIPVPMYTFCHQISGAEFEEQKLTSSQKAMEELLEILLTDQNISEKDRQKKLKQFQKQYPDIYRRRFSSTQQENKKDSKPKIKPPLLTIKKNKTFSIRN